MEKCYKVTLSITSGEGEPAGAENTRSSIIFAYDKEIAWLKTLTDVSREFPSEDGWKHELVSIEEKSSQDLKEHLFSGKPL